MKPVNIDDIKIHKILESSNDPDPNRIKEILHKALNLESLTLEDIVALTKINEPELQNRMFETARKIKEK
ncbi:[FeFe] hydrogenase H-cluster radical SAM maturase HydG, partial [bacterium]|nr:[FeFe] hydrogenase H-cluster radical SAM maturase HydG [bacterium]MBU1025693.1 [FeFe] hydrogenase H-cluster radical SAM maturase HydG [bacterium]